VRFTFAELALLASATDVAVTVIGLAELVRGAVKNPDGDIVPPLAFHVTSVSGEPVTVAENCTLSP
jgi:hypothetical protein